jgi:8-oxo-dGTP pyrophosphatase MutT (NUDIX family)
LLAPFINGVNQKQNTPFLDSKKSAVLLLLGVKQEKLQVVFTLRSQNLLSHSGQISFPGGKSEINETPEETALRETHEEIGILPRNIEILGKLSPIFVLPSNSHIFPVVGFSEKYLDFIVNHDEVEEVFTKPLDFFNFQNINMRKWQIRDEMLIDIPYWAVHPSVPLWGATAMILAEFIEIYRNINKIM